MVSETDREKHQIKKPIHIHIHIQNINAERARGSTVAVAFHHRKGKGRGMLIKFGRHCERYSFLWRANEPQQPVDS